MVRDVRVKEFRFSENINSTTTGSFVSDHNINGEILEVDLTYGSQGATGSVGLFFASNGEEFFRNNSASGTGVQVTRPRAFAQTTIGGIPGTGSEVTEFVTNDNIVLDVGAVLSGTTALQVNVRYR